MKTLSITDSPPECTEDWLDEGTLTEEEVDSITAKYLSKDDSRSYAVRDILRLNFKDYCSRHPVPEFKLRSVNAMMECKTGELGYRLIHCKKCGKIEMRSCSCGNRNCPSCGYLEEKRWTAMRQDEVIPGIPYFHLVFTLPHSLSGIMYQNQKETLNLLFRSVKKTILHLSMKKLKMTPGILMILHSFGSNLSLHYHLHVLVSGGGITKDKSRFKRCLSNQFFLPVKAVQRVYRGKFMEGLKKLHDDKKLLYLEDAEKYRNRYVWKELMDSCFSVPWNVEIKPLSPVSKADGRIQGLETTDNAVTYFARYTNRTAISNSRIVSFDKEQVTFLYKKYHGSVYTLEEMKLSSDEFIRRFLMHFLPRSFSRIRCAGFLAGCIREKSLALIGVLLEMVYTPSDLKSMTGDKLLLHFFGIDVTICPNCGAKIEMLPRMDKYCAAIYIRGTPS